jgi:hypothetical protein
LQEEGYNLGEEEKSKLEQCRQIKMDCRTQYFPLTWALWIFVVSEQQVKILQ